jgi:POT family proton-dependent oligopeptide transporter
VPAASAVQTEGSLVGPAWLVGVYFLHTVGELCLSPVGLSVVTKLAPARIVGSMMGVWFLSIAFGNKLGGWVAGFFDSLPLPLLFGAVAGTTIGAGVLLAGLVKPIRRLMGGVH